MTSIEATAGAVAVMCLFQTIHQVRVAANRWLAVGKAVGGFALVFVFGLIAMIFMPPSSYDNIGLTITFGAPIAAVMGSFAVPTRSKK